MILQAPDLWGEFAVGRALDGSGGDNGLQRASFSQRDLIVAGQIVAALKDAGGTQHGYVATPTHIMRFL